MTSRDCIFRPCSTRVAQAIPAVRCNGLKPHLAVGSPLGSKQEKALQTGRTRSPSKTVGRRKAARGFESHPLRLSIVTDYP